MHGPDRNQQFLARGRMCDFTLDLKFHRAFEHSHDLVSGVSEIFPTLAGRVHPKFATEPAGGPVRRDAFSIDCWHL
jgi:hypothetical protein